MHGSVRIEFDTRVAATAHGFNFSNTGNQFIYRIYGGAPDLA